VRILAHRGSPGSPTFENTVPAISDCLLAGADGIEVDLRLSADGVLVVCHDPALLRLAGSPLVVAETCWDDLRLAAEAAGVPLARVEWVLAAGTGRSVVLEVKAPPPGPRAVDRTVEVLLERIRVLDAAGLPMDLTVSSFAPEVVAAVRSAAPVHLGVRTGLLGRPTVRPGALLRRALMAGHDQIHPHLGALLAEPSVVEAAHRCGVEVVVWTANSGRAVRRLHALGVDAVITDEPARVRLALAGSERRQAA
jgi:glycerophosphoryl diester phosphodiesterase